MFISAHISRVRLVVTVALAREHEETASVPDGVRLYAVFPDSPWFPGLFPHLLPQRPAATAAYVLPDGRSNWSPPRSPPLAGPREAATGQVAESSEGGKQGDCGG